MKKRHILIFSVLAAALSLRIWFAAELPITLDEAWSDRVGMLSWAGVIEEAKKDIHPPLTYAVHKFLTVSETELGVRWFFVLLSFLSIFYLLKLFDYNISALLLLGSSAFLISTGAIARMHALNLFFGAAACYHFIRTFEREKKSDFFLMSLFSLLLLYNFYPSGALVFAFFAVYLIFRKKSVSNAGLYAASFVLIPLLSVPLLYFFNPAAAGGYASEKIISFPSGAILAYLPYAFAYSDNLIRFGDVRGVKILYFFILFSLLSLILLKAATKKDKDLRLKLATWLAMVSVGIVFIVSLKIPKVLYSARYVSWSYPLFAYIFIKGLEYFPGKIKYCLLSAVLIVNFAALYPALKHNPENWREVASFINRNEGGKDVILLDAGHMKYPFEFYYSGKEKIYGLPENAALFRQEDLISYNRIWLILSHNWARKGVYKETVNKKAVLSGDYKFGDIEVFLFKKSAGGK